jgi:DNA-binding LacI/PurR family transcriptional regulator
MAENQPGDEPSLAGSKRPTVGDVAAAAGVSRSTASRALSGLGYTADKVRARVRKAADDLGYVPNIGARSLRQQTSRSIGLAVSDLRDLFYADLAAGAGQAARTAGYSLILADFGGEADSEIPAMDVFLALRVGGVVATANTEALSQHLIKYGLPLVEVDRRFAPERFDGVLVDNFGAAAKVTRYLLALGHRRIALLIDETDWTTGQERCAGYRDAMTGAGVGEEEQIVVRGGWDAEAARLRAIEMLIEDRPTAVFAANNLLAEGVWRAASDLGLRIPGQLAIVAFDDVTWMTMVSPAVTAVSQQPHTLGRVAIETLLERLAHPDAEPRLVTMPTRLIPRGSTAASSR